MAYQAQLNLFINSPTVSYALSTLFSVIMPLHNDVLAAQATSPATVSAANGDDTYLVSGYLLASGQSVTLTDTQGSNSIQFLPGLSITSSSVAANALQLTFSNGAALTVLDADKFTYEVGGNLLQGVDQPDVGFAAFAASALGVTVPATGVTTGGAKTLGTAPAGAKAYTMATAGSDIVLPQNTSPSVLSAAQGNDTYIISAATLADGNALTISDTQGANSIQFVSGLAITGFTVASTALQLTFSSGAAITILEADKFTYEVNGNTVAGLDNADIAFSAFVSTYLGVSLPTTGTVTGGAKTLGGTTPVTVTLPVTAGTSGTLAATAGADVFGFTLATAAATGSNTQVQITGFSTTDDRLYLDLGTAASGLTKLSQINGLDLGNGRVAAVQTNPFTQSTLVTFGLDADGDSIAITLVGVSDPSLVTI